MIRHASCSHQSGDCIAMRGDDARQAPKDSRCHEVGREASRSASTLTVAPGQRLGRIALCGLFVVSMLASTATRGPAQPATVTFAAAGDHAAGAATTASLRALATAGAAFYLALGDLSYGSTGSEQSWCDLVKSTSARASPSSLFRGTTKTMLGRTGSSTTSPRACRTA